MIPIISAPKNLRKKLLTEHLVRKASRGAELKMAPLKKV